VGFAQCHRNRNCPKRLCRQNCCRGSVANHYLETDLEKLKAAASVGYAQGRLSETLPRDRRDGMI
jgi:hypothetical protein